MAATAPVRDVPLRTPVFDASGKLSRTWVIFHENSLDAAGAISLIDDAIATAGLGAGVAAYAW